MTLQRKKLELSNFKLQLWPGGMRDPPTEYFSKSGAAARRRKLSKIFVPDQGFLKAGLPEGGAGSKTPAALGDRRPPFIECSAV